MRTREFNEEKAIQAALITFWKKGFGETSLADLQQATGLGKASLYNAFESKEGLFHQALAMYLTEVGKQYQHFLCSDANPKIAISNLFHGLVDKASKPPHGCLLVLSVQNSAQHSLALRKIFAAALRSREDKLRETVSRIYKNDSVIEDMTQSLCVFIDGLLTRARSGVDAQTLHRTIDVTLKAFFEMT